MKQCKMAIVIMVFMLVLVSCDDNASTDIVNKYNELYAISDWSYIESDDTPIDEYIVTGRKLQYYDGHLYFFNGPKSSFLTSLSNNEIVPTLIKLNLENGTMTPVCSDPLCNHATPSCPFAGAISFIYINDNTVYYHRTYSLRENNESYGYVQFCSYNLETMEMRIYKQEEIVSGKSYGESIKKLFYNNYCYYYDLLYDSEKDISIWKIMRLDLDTGSEVYLGDMENENGFVMEYLFIIGDRIYFRDAQSIFSTDLDLNDKQVHIEGRFPDEDIYTDGENIYYSVLTDDKSKSYKLYRCGLDGSEIIDLGIVSTSGWFITTNYIYYTHPNRFELEYAGGGTLPFFYDAIYRCDHDGQNSELVYEAFHRNNENPDNYIQLQNCIAVGNYVFAQYYGVDDKNGNNIIDEGEQYDSYNHLVDYNIMRIDIINQKYELIYPNRE